MRTKIDALYDLAKKIKGTADKQDSIVEMIDQIKDGLEPTTAKKNIIELNTDLQTIGTQEEVEIEEADVAKLNEAVQANLQDSTVYPEAFLNDGNYYMTKYFSVNDGDYVVQIWSGASGYWELYEATDDKWYGIYIGFLEE